MTAGACRDYALKYQLSDWTVFSVSLPLQMSSVKVAERAPPERQPGPPDSPLAEGSEGFLVRALPIAETLSPIGAAGDYLRYVQLQYRHCIIDFRSSFEEYQKKFSSKTRSTINRKVRKYAGHSGGTLSWKTYRTVRNSGSFFRWHARWRRRPTRKSSLTPASRKANGLSAKWSRWRHKISAGIHPVRPRTPCFISLLSGSTRER